MISDFISTLDHPAVQAWMQISGESNLPTIVHSIEESTKSSIYRLVDTQADGTSVIAKRSLCSTAQVERMIYEDFLPLLPLSSLHYYGSIVEANGKFCWLFLEDIGKLLNLRALEQHRLVLSQWLAKLHTASSQLQKPTAFPVKHAGYFLQRLQTTRIAFLERLDNTRVPDRERLALEGFVQQCDLLESHWEQIKSHCRDLPQCLFHGDVANENIGIRSDLTGVQILVFDWEKAGWGEPVIDLPEVDLKVYHSLIKQTWPNLSMVRLRDLQRCGKIFSVLSRNLGSKPEKKLKHYLGCLRSAMRELGINESSDGKAVTVFGITNQEKILNHLATLSWLALNSDHNIPESIAMIHTEPDRSTVYRLAAAGPSRSSVIAKSTRIELAHFESLIYERVLSRLSISTPKYFGFLPDSDGESAWLFVQDMGELRWDRNDPVHQKLAARWLAALHTGSENLAKDLPLPFRTQSHYRNILQNARLKIISGMDNPALSDQHLNVLRDVLKELERIDNCWEQVDLFCDRIPMTIMHGDFVEKNLRLSQNRMENTLFAFDWESVGYGVPAQDLASVDAAAYFLAVQPFWPHLTELLVRRLVRLGQVFWTLQLIDWASDNLCFTWAQEPISKQILYYEVWLREAYQAFLYES